MEMRPAAASYRGLQKVSRWPLVSQLEFGKAWADTWNVMRYDVHPPDFANVEAGDEAGLFFAAFSLEHAACGDDLLEVRLGDETLLEWCMACSVMMIFRTDEK
jgi:hypothetical protein